MATRTTTKKSNAKKTSPKRTSAKKPATKQAASKSKATPASKKSTTSRATKPKTPNAKPESKPKKLSAIDAAAQVLAKSKASMNCKELIEALSAKKLWTSPGGKTPHATLYSAILREIKSKGKDSRFKKKERGQFVANK